MKKKLTVMLLVLAMLVLLIPTVSKIEAEAAVIPNASPAIPANVGEKIDLSSYSAVFDDGVTYSGLSWKNGSTAITSFTPSAKGVTALTATNANGVSKQIYVVAKNVSETEYTLFYDDFSSDTLSQYSMLKAESCYSISDGTLIIDARDAAIDRAILMLPSWLSDFGDYKIDAKATIKNAVNSTRWVSIVFRAQDAGTPYYQMAVRQDAKISGGIEFAERTANDAGWNVPSTNTSSYTAAISESTYYTFTVATKGDNVDLRINNTSYISRKTSTVTNQLAKGGIGLQACLSQLYVDYIKVDLQLEDFTAISTTSKTVYGTNIASTVGNTTIIDSFSDFASLSSNKSETALMYVDDNFSVVTKDGEKICRVGEALAALGAKHIPAFYVSTETAASVLATYLKNIGHKDATIIASNAEVLGKARENYKYFRGALDFSGVYTGTELTKEQLASIRATSETADAKIAILPSRFATKENVYYLHSLALAVWVMCDDKEVSKTEIVSMITSGAFGVISYKPQTVAASFSLFASNSYTRTPLVVAHRGYSSEYPENSLGAYKAAIQNGADVIETDVRLSKDGVVMVMHDATVDATTDGTGSVSALTAAQMQKMNVTGRSNNSNYKYNASSTEKVPTLEQVFQLVVGTDVKIFLEIKDNTEAIVAPIVSLINKYDIHDQICIITFYTTVIDELAKQLPSMSAGYLVSNTDYSSAALSTTALVDAALVNANNLIYPYSATFNPSYAYLTADYIKQLNVRGTSVFPYTYNSTSSVNSAFLMSVSAITTNYPNYTKDVVKTISASANVLELVPGGTASITVNATTYGGTVSDVTSSAIVVWIEGKENVSYRNGIFSCESESLGKTASFMFRYAAKTNSGTTFYLYTQPITVSVKRSLTLTTDSKMKLDKTAGLVYAYEDGFDVSTLKNNFNDAEYITVKSADSTVLDETDKAVNGVKISFEDLKALTLIIIGDVNSDGTVDQADYLELKAYFKGILPLDSNELISADIDANTMITASDYIMIKRKLMGQYTFS